MTGTLHPRAVVTGAAMALAVAVPTAILAQVLDEAGPVDDNSSWLIALFAVVLAGLVTGGYVAANRRPDAPMVNGAAAALAAYAVVQTIGIARLLATDEDITWVGIPFFALLSTAAGMAGGLLAERRSRRPR